MKWKWADGKEWVLCNLASQQGLFRTLDGLSRLTGEPRYKEAALGALRYAFDHLRYGTDNNGGLLAWGGHLTYNATDDVIMGNPDGTGRIHELKCFYPHYELMWEANAEATRQLIENMWNGHVLDWATLDFNRHGNPKKLGALWRNEYRGGAVFFDGKGLTFHNAGSDFYYAAGMLSKLSARASRWSGPDAWRIATLRPATPRPDSAVISSASAKTRGVTTWARFGATAQYQYGDDFKGHRVVEGTLFPCYGDTPEVEPQVGCLLLGEQLGETGRDFTRWVVEELTAWQIGLSQEGQHVHPHAHRRHQHGGVRVQEGRLFRAEGPGAPRGPSRAGPFLALRLGLSPVQGCVPVGDGAEHR